ncbi:MAG: serine hydrolase [Candidatus Sulfotelmatobacter sp.]
MESRECSSVGDACTAVILLFGILLVCFVHAHAAQAEQAAKIASLMSALHERGQFNGAVLVAARGSVIYRGAFGKANFQTNTDLTPETPLCLASVTKQFTAMAIMILAEEGKLDYDDSVSKYVREFSRSERMSKITVRQLLTHTSGIPDFGDLAVDDSLLTQEGLIEVLLQKESLFSSAGQKYRYSNPGYVLLAIVVERVSGQSFSDFLEQKVFKPLGMGSTFVYDNPLKRNRQAATGYDQFGQEDDVQATSIPGDGGIYSTVDDLLKWDQALYTDKLVPQSALAVAFTPGKVEEGSSTYGFGWNVGDKGGGKYVWHTGSTAGFRAFIERRLTDRVTVILLTNKGNSKRTEMNDAILNILAGRPYVMPRMSGAEKLYGVIRASGTQASGIQTALQLYDSLKTNTDYDLGESELNTLGYQLLNSDKRVDDAIAIFKLNTTAHPLSSNAYDSLAEAYRKSGAAELAISNYQNAVMLDSSNLHAVAMLKEMGQHPRNRFILLLEVAGVVLLAIAGAYAIRIWRARRFGGRGAA